MTLSDITLLLFAILMVPIFGIFVIGVSSVWTPKKYVVAWYIAQPFFSKPLPLREAIELMIDHCGFACEAVHGFESLWPAPFYKVNPLFVKAYKTLGEGASGDAVFGEMTRLKMIESALSAEQLFERIDDHLTKNGVDEIESIPNEG